MTRDDRRTRTALIIKRRERVMAHKGALGKDQRTRGHRLHKRDGLGHCGNKRCSLCGVMRAIKKKEKRAERYSARKAVSHE